jgi:hypothetical protein
MTVRVVVHDSLRGTEEIWEHPGPVTTTITNGQLVMTTEIALLGRWKLIGISASDLRGVDDAVVT